MALERHAVSTTPRPPRVNKEKERHSPAKEQRNHVYGPKIEPNVMQNMVPGFEGLLTSGTETEEGGEAFLSRWLKR